MKNNNKGFTLAETLIVIMIIGILSAVLIPVASKIAPDEKIIKFKKGHLALENALNELVTSDKYYLNGDLGMTVKGKLINGRKGDEYTKYFCQTMADVLDIKSSNCYVYDAAHNGSVDLRYGFDFNQDYHDHTRVEITEALREKTKARIDYVCKKFVNPDKSTANDPAKAQLRTNDEVIFYETNPKATFGIASHDNRRHSSPNDFPANSPDENGYDTMYKVLCMDVDGINQGEDPFGYGIRADGKLLTGKRADEWLQKSIKRK